MRRYGSKDNETCVLSANFNFFAVAGGGTFDVTLLAIDNGVFEVRATSGNTHLVRAFCEIAGVRAFALLPNSFLD